MLPSLMMVGRILTAMIRTKSMRFVLRRSILFAFLAGPILGTGAWAQQPALTVLSGSTDILFLPFYVADKEKLFEQEGLVVNRRYFVAGKLAVDALVAGAGVMAAAGSLVSVVAATSAPVYIVAPLSRGRQVMRLVASPKIRTVTDLRGKRIGFQFGTEGHYVVHTLLENAGIPRDQVILQNISVQALPAAFVRGDLDALVAWDPHAAKALEVVPDAHVLTITEALSSVYALLTMREDFVKTKPEMAEKLLRAMLRAREVIRTDPERAARAAADVMKASLPQVKYLMSKEYGMTYTMELDEAFFKRHDDAAVFLVRSGLTRLKKVNVHELVYPKLLQDIDSRFVKPR